MTRRHSRPWTAAAGIGFLLGPACTAAPRASAPQHAVAAAPAPALQCVIVGGGPTPRDNEVAIESNVLYVRRLLPAGTETQILWADGHPAHANVAFLQNGKDRFRRSTLTQVDGSNEPNDVYAAIEQSWKPADRPLLLYFTGHGSPDYSGRQNCSYASWDDQSIRVSDLRRMLDLPGRKRVTLVMVQCFSGAFAGLLLDNSRGAPSLPDAGPDESSQAAPKEAAPNPPDAPPPGDEAARVMADARIDDSFLDRIRPDFCGFFASLSTREAAGCTDEVDQAYYHDFTSYFFAALSGKDRLGKPSTGADYDHDGKVGMYEAFAYALINDVSIDTPVCTSDVFLRQAVVLKDPEIFRLPFSTVRGWATPAQAAVLDALSKRLSLSGENRLQRAYNVFLRRSRTRSADIDADTACWIRYVRIAKDAALRHILLEMGSPDIRTAYLKLEALEAENPVAPGAPATSAEARRRPDD